MNPAKNICFAIQLLLTAALLAVLPSVVNGSFINTAQTGKTLFFLTALLVLLPMAVVVLILDRAPPYFKCTRLDLIISIWFVYLVSNAIIRGTSFSLSMAEFFGLALFFILLRVIPLKHYTFLFPAFIAGGIYQAVYGNLQLLGYYPSLHNLFKLTGSFFNPGPYAGYLAMVFPAALGFWLWGKNREKEEQETDSKQAKNQHNWRNRLQGWKLYFTVTYLTRVSYILPGKAIYYLSITALLTIVLVLPASQSRAAWLAVMGASFYLPAVKYGWWQKLKAYNITAGKKVMLLVILIPISMAGAAGLYLLKKGSADGRLLTWKISSEIIADNPVTGTGFNGFKACYMEYQARYFENNTESAEALAAGDNNYAFNELVQQTVQHGLAGSLLLLLVFITAFSVKPVSKTVEPRLSPFQSPLFLIPVSKALLLSFVVFSMFSYPVQILPIKLGLVLALACLAANSRKIVMVNKGNKKSHPIVRYIIMFCITGVVFTVVYFGAGFLKQQTEALKGWKYAYMLYGMGDYERSTAAYEKVYPVLRYNGDFLTNYGKALSLAEKNREAVEVLLQAAKFYPNIVVYTALGDSYKAIGEYDKAERAYLRAWYMNPSRFYPQYLLARLYDETGQAAKALATARYLLHKEVKVPSQAIDEILEAMREIIEKHKKGEYRPTAITDRFMH